MITKSIDKLTFRFAFQDGYSYSWYIPTPDTSADPTNIKNNIIDLRNYCVANNIFNWHSDPEIKLLDSDSALTSAIFQVGTQFKYI